MFNISKYLEKFKKNVDKGSFLNESIVNIIKKHTEIDILKEDIDIKSNIIYIKISPLYKNKIFIYKENVLEEINKISSINYIDIRYFL